MVPPPWQDVYDPRTNNSLVTHNLLEEYAVLPVVDLGLLCQGNEAEIQKLVMAAKEWGFLQVANHGVSRKLLNEMEDQACRAFALPGEAKMRAEPAAGSFHGYLSKSEDNVSRMLWSEALRLPLNPLQREDVITKLWPEGNAAFSSAVEKYIATVEQILLQLLKNLASGIGLDPLHFTQDVSNDGHSAVLRMNFYPTSSKSSAPTLGLVAHSDPQVLTILHQNGVDGLQILKDDKWVAVKVRRGSFVVNVGDILQVMSNDLYTSVVHRVVMKRDQFRVTILCGMSLHPKAIVRPAPELVTDKRTLQYRPFTPEEYFISLLSNGVYGKTHLDRFKTSPGL
ncbi:hypothetical protein O6H91_19G054700 [Diphasiastrum complanatum]|uniref:Uncharacterized protein n=1 Tax=Diphasiastrum complanatum TaxID=34168 RepID=A0ACC2AV80_DIPCM|nr:hypothetical protein O6H91_19G054700 [Diphasiastrum complanatum]